MDSLFCCSSIEPFRPKRLLHEQKFTDFMDQVKLSSIGGIRSSPKASSSLTNDTYVVQLVQQENYGPLEWKKYFVATKHENETTSFHEVTEQDLIEANFKKLNA